MSIQSCSGPRLEISYLATRPETVFSLVSTGQFPPFLPSYLSENRSFSRLDPTPKKSIVGMSTLCRQVFIIELAIPSGSITPPLFT